MKSLIASGIVCCCIVVAGIWTAEAFAQSVPASGDAAALQEIVVTAEKREERSQDVPIAMVALGGEQLKNKGIDSALQLQFAAPDLNIGLLAGFAQPFMRGIGGDIVSPNAETGVATYVDGAYDPNLGGIFSNFVGVDRVEVLYGPQGTLYGKNAVGGAINVVTLSPSQDFDARVSGKFGNYSETQITGFISGPLTDKLAIGLYAGGTVGDGYLTYVSPITLPGQPGHELDGTVRLKAVYEPIDPLKFVGTLERTRTVSFDDIALRQEQPNAVGFAAGGVVTPRYVVGMSWPAFINMTQDRGLLRAEYDMGWSRVLSLTSYQTVEQGSTDDPDGTTAALVATGGHENANHTTSEELQLQAPVASSVQWILGLYGYKDHGGFDPNFTVLQSLISVPNVLIDNHGLINTTSGAIFGQVTVPLGDQWRLTLGGRYSHDRKVFYARDATYTLPAGTITPMDGATDGPLIASNNYPTQEKSWGQFTPKVTVDYRMGGTLLYATYGKGYKSGTFNISAAGQPPVNPETLQAFEIGSKSDFFSERLRINTSLYHYDYKDLQVTAYVEGGVAAETNFLQNAASAKIEGADLSVAFALTRALTLNWAASYLNAYYSSFPGYAGVVDAVVGNASAQIDATGHRLERAPRWVSSGSIDYAQNVPSGGKVDANIGLYFNGGFYWDASEQPEALEHAYTLVNASVGYSTPDEHWRASLWTTNLTDTYHHNFLLRLTFGTDVQEAPPRMFGGSLAYKFK